MQRKVKFKLLTVIQEVLAQNQYEIFGYLNFSLFVKGSTALTLSIGRILELPWQVASGRPAMR